MLIFATRVGVPWVFVGVSVVVGKPGVLVGVLKLVDFVDKNSKTLKRHSTSTPFLDAKK